PKTQLFIACFRTQSNLQFSFCKFHFAIPFCLPLSTFVYPCLLLSTLFPSSWPFLAIAFHDNLSPYAKSICNPPHTRGARRFGFDLSGPAESRLLSLPRHPRRHDSIHVGGRSLGSLNSGRPRPPLDHPSLRRDSPGFFARRQDNRLLRQLR